MPIKGIVQPEIIQIDPTLRLRKFDGIFDFALAWYQSPEIVYLVDGVKEPYSPEKLRRMYAYLDAHGELYFIEELRNGAFVPIGDVTFWQQDMPIVLGDPACRGRGVGGKVIAALIGRGRSLGFDRLYVSEIYDWNPASRRCFERAGFHAYENTEKGSRYMLEL